MRMIRALCNSSHDLVCGLLLGCGHHHLSRPFTIEKETYLVCLDCGRKLYYSTDMMRPFTPRELRRLRAAESGKVRVIPVSAEAQAAAQERKTHAA